jgi:hypothetical protein
MRARLFLPGLAALTSFGCGDPHESNPTNLRVSVSTVGVDQDDGYAIRAGGGAPQPIRGSLILFLPPGEHDVVLEGIAPNCSVQGPDSVRVTIVPGQVSSAAFQVACRAVTGAIEVAAPTSGRDFDADGYTVHVDDALATRVFSGGSVVVEGMSPGSHAVRLDDVSGNCGLSGSPSQRRSCRQAGSPATRSASSSRAPARRSPATCRFSPRREASSVTRTAIQ